MYYNLCQVLFGRLNRGEACKLLFYVDLIDSMNQIFYIRNAFHGMDRS
jgi:hypothetical protein